MALGLRCRWQLVAVFMVFLPLIDGFNNNRAQATRRFGSSQYQSNQHPKNQKAGLGSVPLRAKPTQLPMRARPHLPGYQLPGPPGRGSAHQQPKRWDHAAYSASAITRVGRTVMNKDQPPNPANRLYPVKTFEKEGTKFIPPIHHRWELAELCQQEGLKVGVEIGVMKGTFALNNLKKWNATKYYLVDAWSGVQEHYKDIKKEHQESNYQTTLHVLKPYKDKIEIIRDFSVAAAKKVPDNSVDFVYVDARHDYIGVHEDIEAWWPKLKKDGLMTGHDYVDSTHLSYYIGRVKEWKVNIDDGGVRTDGKSVFSAVNEFAEANHRQVQATSWETDGGFRTWLIRK